MADVPGRVEVGDAVSMEEVVIRWRAFGGHHRATFDTEPRPAFVAAPLRKVAVKEHAKADVLCRHVERRRKLVGQRPG